MKRTKQSDPSKESLAFSRILKSLRLKNNMTQEDLASEGNLDRTYISMLERSINQPTLTSLFELSRALNLKASDMVRLVEIELDSPKQQ
ncbi:helix-turn-helix domain-containing protein [Candidatus Pristimantibacillus sp. PTI5]|uniref:helix-turn-helix domain-containing protein n=1 Tax=Candidatus Pristimantibacillus sp. PTI5 TaxID=3400422 RepID=UPI003B01CF27